MADGTATPPSGNPFGDIRALGSHFQGIDKAAAGQVAASLAGMLSPPGGLGDLGDLAPWVAGWQQNPRPTSDQAHLCLFASSHGVAGARGEGPEPAERLAAMSEGRAAINHLCGHEGAGLRVFDLAIDIPTADFRHAAALSARDCAGAIAFGMESTATGADILCLGTMARGGDIAVAAVAAALTGGSAEALALPDAHPDTAKIVEAGLAKHRKALRDPLEILRRLGGREIAATLGGILAARVQGIPVVLDGPSTVVAAVIAGRMFPGGADHCIAPSSPGASAYEALLDVAAIKHVIVDGAFLGEGAGAIAVLGRLRAATALASEAAARQPGG